jgi:phosphoribosylglycinamide formyltransferase-1
LIDPYALREFPVAANMRGPIAAVVERHGATVHFVSAGVDQGPVVLQASVPVHSGDTPETLGSRVLEQEHRILPQAIRWFAQGRLRCEAGSARLDGRPAVEVARLEDF